MLKPPVNVNIECRLSLCSYQFHHPKPRFPNAHASLPQYQITRHQVPARQNRSFKRIKRSWLSRHGQAQIRGATSALTGCWRRFRLNRERIREISKTNRIRPQPGSQQSRPEHASSGQQQHRRYGAAKNGLLLYGIHAVAAALANPARTIGKVYATPTALTRLEDNLIARDAAPISATPRELDQLLGARQAQPVHQGVVLDTKALPEPSLQELAEATSSASLATGSSGTTDLATGGRATRGRPLLILDQVTDPHNVGAIVRSAAVFGAAGIIMTRRNSPPLEGVLAKSASGGLEHVPICLVSNLARAITDLQKLGLICIGLDGEAPALLEDQDFDSSIALILGAEGAGLRRLTRENCDLLCRISTRGPLASLNVSNAAAVALHLAAMGRG